MSVTSQVHDLAIMRDGHGRDGRLHHIEKAIVWYGGQLPDSFFDVAT
jgi:hypothetical protein